MIPSYRRNGSNVKINEKNNIPMSVPSSPKKNEKIISIASSESIIARDKTNFAEYVFLEKVIAMITGNRAGNKIAIVASRIQKNPYKRKMISNILIAINSIEPLIKTFFIIFTI